MIVSFQIEGILRTATGKPGEVICQISDEEEAAMIIVGSRGMGKIRRTILGSVSDYLVNHAYCPVVVCRHPSSFKPRRPSASSSEGKRSRHASGDSLKSHSRHASGDSTSGKHRHKSGDWTGQKSLDSVFKSQKSMEKIKSRSLSVGSEEECVESPTK